MGHIVMRSRQTGCCTAATSPKLLNSRSSKCPRTSARGDEVRQEAQLEVVSRCFKVFPGIQPLKFATEFNGLQEKNLGLPAGLPTGPTSLCILPSSGDPRWKFLGIPNDGDMSWNDGTPQKIPMQNRNSFARKSNDGTPQVLISSFTTVSTILWQTPQKKKELSLTQPVHNKPHLPAKHHIHVASWKPSKWLSTLRWAKLTLVISLDSWNHLNDVSFMTFFLWESYRSSPELLPDPVPQFLTSLCSPHASGRPFCAVPHNHSPSTSKIHKRSPRLCFMRGWLAPWNLPFQWRHTYMLCVCIYERIDRWIWMWMWMRICICVFWNAGYMNSSKTFKNTVSWISDVAMLFKIKIKLVVSLLPVL